MRWTPKHISIGMLTVAAAGILAGAAMNPIDTTTDTAGPIGSGLSVDTSSDGPGDAPIPSTPRPVITLGDLDPPPDPCTVIGWTDSAAPTRPMTTPRRHSPGRGDDRTGMQRTDTNQYGRPMCIGLTPAAGSAPGTGATTSRLSIADACAAVAAALLTIAKAIR